MKPSRKRRIWTDEDMACELLDSPPEQKSKREIDRLQAILDEIKVETLREYSYEREAAK
jgi:hypothetical protein